MQGKLDFDAKRLFGDYMKLVDVPKLSPEETSVSELFGKKLGLINGSAWIQLWSYYFGRVYLPGVKLINVGNEAIQLNFMKAHEEGKKCPPKSNIELFGRYAKELVELSGVDAILITCSTMNRSFSYVQKMVEEYRVPVISIDQPMMEKCVNNGGKVLIVATHGPTVNNTRRLLEDTAQSMGKRELLEYTGATVEEAFELLGEGKIDAHNEAIAQAIKDKQSEEKIDQVVLAQLSMSVFKLSYPNPEKTFGIPVLTSGEEGFKKVYDVLTNTVNK